MDGVTLAPVRGRARIDVLDMLRGIAILGIFYMNIQFMASAVFPAMTDIRLGGWTLADRWVWGVIQAGAEGTQRCMLEYLFGAGMMVLTARAMDPDGPVAIADLYYRRNLWLIAFGLFDIFGLLWAGDILLIYGIAALFLFPFRKLPPKALVAIGLIWAVLGMADGVSRYTFRTDLIARIEAVHGKQARHAPLSAEDQRTVRQWNRVLDEGRITGEVRNNMAREQAGHRGGFTAYAGFYWWVWTNIIFKSFFTFITVAEAFCAMLIGIALWKWRVIQGGRSARFYAVLALIAYAVGLTIRVTGVLEIYRFDQQPQTIWATAEFGRLAMGLGHVALVNLLVKSRIGAALLSPFKAAGRTAFSLYFCEQIIGLYVLFSPFGLNLWDRFGWAGEAAVATGVVAFLLFVANVWVRFFAMGPLEWLWRSLAYLERQPFRLQRGHGALGSPEADPAQAPLAS